MEIRYHLSASDMEATRLHLQALQLLNGPGRGWKPWRNLSIWVVTTLSLALLSQADSSPYPPWVWMLAGGTLFASALWVAACVRSGRCVRWSAQCAGEHALTLTPAGISRSTPDGWVSFCAWSEVLALETADTGLYIYLGRDVAWSVPRAAVQNAALDAFAEEARLLWRADPANAGASLSELPTAPESPLRQAWADWRAALRLLFFRDFDLRAFRVSSGALAALLLAELCLIALADMAEALPAPVFSLDGARDYAATVLVTFAWAVFISHRAPLRAPLLGLLVMVTAVTLAKDTIYLPVYLVAEWFLPDADGLLWAIYAASLLWMAATVFRIAQGLHGQPGPAALNIAAGYVVLALALAVVLPGRLYVDGADDPAGYQDEGGRYASASKLDAEDAFYRQPELVRQVLEELSPHTPGETGLYFVGFAGDGSEREFGNEVRYAWDLLDRRFHTIGHSLALINDADTVSETPLANAHNLEAVLQGLAQRMDTRKDVLFLFLSSHGAQDHRLAVSFSPLAMNDLKAEKLKEMLDNSGIRNRIIVVSACYSGGFLDVLKDDNTLILTASSRDHVAYGCGDVTEYTYFGEAYFVKALKQGDSFIAAFEEARRLIAEREKKEGADPSNPQIYVGRNIGKVLQTLKVVPARKVDGCPENCPAESG